MRDYHVQFNLGHLILLIAGLSLSFAVMRLGGWFILLGMILLLGVLVATAVKLSVVAHYDFVDYRTPTVSEVSRPEQERPRVEDSL